MALVAETPLPRYRFFRRQGYAAAYARELARAECWADLNGYGVRWEGEDNPDTSWCDDCNARKSGHSHEITCAIMTAPGGETVVASLGNIVDADAVYTRVVEAELAIEAYANWRRQLGPVRTQLRSDGGRAWCTVESYGGRVFLPVEFDTRAGMSPAGARALADALAIAANVAEIQDAHLRSAQ